MTTAHPFTRPEQDALGALVGLIIPASAEFDQPGADDPAILQDILTSGAPLRPRLGAALDSLARTPPRDVAQALAFRQAFPAEALAIQTLTMQCYYRDARVMQALGLAVRPPFPKGYVQEPNDFSLLDPVRQRGGIYRKPSG